MFVKHKDIKKCLQNTKPQTSGRQRKYGWKSCLQNMSAVCQSFFRRHKDMSLKICTTLSVGTFKNVKKTSNEECQEPFHCETWTQCEGENLQFISTDPNKVAQHFLIPYTVVYLLAELNGGSSELAS
ncbi:CLUMA_CG010187, isoform A [Clunio marinus]|uniref:CLUMA_CG010187, isoform A n=1 Tax=Clunio marinus TaxID=568069 RepID=A0A1J1IAM7_9DIPT|nr:CLUMA_CG010187, isoform A [Clunio marinus]